MSTKPKEKVGESLPIAEVVLQFLEGENEGVEIRVNAPREMTMGRSEECDIFLSEKKISRKHSILSVTKDYVRLSDLQSTNGTFVNSKKITESILQDQDKFRLGNSLIQVSIVRGEPKAVEPEPEPAPEDEEIPEEAPKIVDEPSGAFAFSSAGFSELAKAKEEVEEEVEEEDEEPEPDFEREPPSVEPPARLSEPKAKPLSGNLSAMGLADLLQNLGQNRKSGILRLTAQREGKIWIHEGKVMAASVSQATGNKALFRMLGWNEGEFELQPLPEDFDPKEVKDQITDSVETLLMEGFRQYDELQKIRKGLPELSASLKLKPKFTAPLSKLHPRVLDILQVVINEGGYEAVLDASPLSDLETAKVVFYLLKKKYIE